MEKRARISTTSPSSSQRRHNLAASTSDSNFCKRGIHRSKAKDKEGGSALTVQHLDRPVAARATERRRVVVLDTMARG